MRGLHRLSVVLPLPRIAASSFPCNIPTAVDERIPCRNLRISIRACISLV